MDAVKNKKTAWVKNTRASLFLLKCVLSLNVMFKKVWNKDSFLKNKLWKWKHFLLILWLWMRCSHLTSLWPDDSSTKMSALLNTQRGYPHHLLHCICVKHFLTCFWFSYFSSEVRKWLLLKLPYAQLRQCWVAWVNLWSFYSQIKYLFGVWQRLWGILGSCCSTCPNNQCKDMCKEGIKMRRELRYIISMRMWCSREKIFWVKILLKC